MVIVNPKLSLPSDLPYKKRQRPFLSNTPLQQATIRYNEAIRKKYNDIQFAKRVENGTASQSDLPGVNTIEISKMVDPTLFAEMSNMNPLTIVKKRRSKHFDSGNSCSGDILGGNCNGSHGRLHSTNLDNNNMRPLNTSGPVQAGTETFPVQNANSNVTNNFICNNNEMFPQLQATVSMEGEKKSSSTNYYAAATIGNNKPPSTPSLEAQAINEYEPTIDSAHDMIFGNVMGIDYGNYVHAPLWGPQQACGNSNNASCDQSPAQHFQATSPTLCCNSKLSGVGYGPVSHSSPPPPLYDGSSNIMVTDNVPTAALPVMGKHVHYGGPGGTGRRSTSVPRPRTGTQKETLKQAAIRCGIIKGSHVVSTTIPKRSHCLVPLQLAPVQSDPVVSVVEILHPKGTIPACSSEALVEFEDFRFKPLSADSNNSEVYLIHNNKSTPALNIVMNVPGDCAKLNHNNQRMEKSNSDGNGQVSSSETDPSSSSKMLDNAISCPTI